MLLLLFVLSAHAQSYGYGAGTSVPQNYPAAPKRTSALAPPQDAQTPTITQFQLRQANRNVAVSEADFQGNRVFYNVPLETFGPNFVSRPLLTNLGLAYKADSAAQQEQYFQREINHLRATTPQLTRADRDKIDDFALQRDAARNTKLRRGVGLIEDPFSPPFLLGGSLGPLSAFYDVRAKQDGWILAQNALTDAQRAYQADPSQANFIALRNARDGVAQADHREDASTFDLISGFGDSTAVFGPVFRKKASETKLDTGLRNLRVARQVYAQEPSEDNWYKLRLADLFVRATTQEDDANRNDIGVTFALQGVLGSDAGLANTILSGKNFEDESRLWLRYARLQREQLYRQAGSQSFTGSNPVADQMMGLAMYGPAGSRGSTY